MEENENIKNRENIHREKFEEFYLSSRKESVEIGGREQFFKLRNKWSWCIVLWITILLAFQISITIFLGLEKLDFSKQIWFLPSLLLQNFLQIIGMGYVIVKFLYPKNL